MGSFKQFKVPVEKQYKEMCKQQLFTVSLSKEELWEKYLSSFPEGSNPIYKKRTGHDCNCCKNFVTNIGKVVTIKNGQLTTVWDVTVSDNPAYQAVADAMSALVKNAKIENIWVTNEPKYGADVTRQMLDDGKVHTWDHFHGVTPNSVHSYSMSVDRKLGDTKTEYNLFKRGLETITMDSLTVVADLIQQNLLHRGNDYKKAVNSFIALKKDYDKSTNKSIWLWLAVASKENSHCTGIRNTAIGTLLIDLSEGKELTGAVKSFEDKVSGTNFKRTTALVTDKMRKQASDLVKEKGYTESLFRRRAMLTDIPVEHMLFVDRSVTAKLSGNPFDILDVKQDVKSFNKVESVTIDDFIKNVLPSITSMEVFLENKHRPNLVGLIAAVEPTAPNIFKWNNTLSWCYTGDVADSVKERVKQAGGNVEGDLRISLSWFNTDDLDLGVHEPGGNRIYFGMKKSHKTGGELDVDMNCWGNFSREAVENVIYRDKQRMVPGEYVVRVTNFTKRENVDVGFQLDVEFGGVIHTLTHKQAVIKHVDACVIKVDKDKNIQLSTKLEQTVGGAASINLWGLPTQCFHKVNLLMLSPNYWDGQEIGNKQYMFMLEGCKDNEPARGFYNEFLTSELHDIRKALEMLGSKLKTDTDENQLSGLGFSSTQRNELICRVKGSFNRVVKILF